MLNISQHGRVQVIELAHGKVNALDLELLQAMNAALATADPSEALVLTGAGRAFCAGVDLRRLLAEDLDHTHAFLDALTECFHRIYDHPAPVVAAVNGAAIAGGCIVAAAADRRFMSGGTIGLTEMAVGVPIPTVGIEIVRNVVGTRVQDMVLSAKLMNPLEALSAGLVDVLVEAEELRDAAVQEAERLVAAPIEVVRLTKRQLQAPARERFPADRAQDEAATKQLWVSDSVRQTMADFMAALSAPAR